MIRRGSGCHTALEILVSYRTGYRNCIWQFVDSRALALLIGWAWNQRLTELRKQGCVIEPRPSKLYPKEREYRVVSVPADILARHFGWLTAAQRRRLSP